jgi:hypothetical protein
MQHYVPGPEATLAWSDAIVVCLALSRRKRNFPRSERHLAPSARTSNFPRLAIVLEEVVKLPVLGLSR